RFEAVKGLDVLLRAWQSVSSEASLVLAGDGPLRAHLHGTNVHVLPPLSHQHVPGFLKALDVLVLPSVTILPLHREQFGRVLVEAMAAGVPVIGSTSGAIPEVIGDAGLLVPERDPDALARAIETVLEDSALRQRLVDAGRERVRLRFTWPVVAEHTLTLFRSAMLHRRRAAAYLEEVRA
ncbi:MAG TPA: glycosyltransferase family 4 protein, partial [Chloroflexota bacterium]|nr:glycosyltransferase family 4 protein [Chloroflexota bacterium]